MTNQPRRESQNHTNQRESVLDDTDLHEEQQLVDLFFKRIDTAKAITGSWYKLWFFAVCYVFCTLSACSAIYLNSAYDGDRNVADSENVLVVILILLQSFTCVSSLMLLKSVLANQAICVAYVEYNILDHMRRFPEPSPAISLYFKGHVSAPKKRMNIKEQIKTDSRYLRYYYYKFVVLTLLTVYLWFAATLSSDKTFYSVLVLPWGIMTFSTAPLNRFIFTIIGESLEYHKRELLNSPVFSNMKWEELIKVLSNASRFRQRGHIVEKIPWFTEEVEDHENHKNSTISKMSSVTNSIEMNNIYHNNSIVSMTSNHNHNNSIFGKKSPMHLHEDSHSPDDETSHNASDIEAKSNNNDIEASSTTPSVVDSNMMSHMSVQRVLSDSSTIASYFLQQTTANIPTGIEINLLKHEALQTRQKLKESVYKILGDEGEALDIKRLRQDLFLLQHVYCVYNSVLGLPFSINAVLTLWLLLYILYLTLTEGNFHGSIIIVFEYVVIISVYTIYQNISLLLNSNSISTSIKAFCGPLVLLCPEEKLEELTTLQEAIPSMNLFIRVFGISITQEYCFSLFFSLGLSVSGQLYKILVGKT